MTIKGNEIFFEFDIWEFLGTEKPKSGTSDLKAELKEYLLTEVLSYVGEGKSPVAGGAWKKSLSKAYKKRKSEFSSVGFANMELTGDMLDKLEIVTVGDKMKLRIKGKESARADGHNNHSGKSRLPPREFIPKEGQTFKRDIVAGAREIAREFLDDA